MNTITYIVVDIEVDGPTPGIHSMLNLAAVAADANIMIVGEFTRNLELLPEGEPDSDTMKWWSENALAYQRIRQDIVHPERTINEFVQFVEKYPGDKILVGHPLVFDGLWVDYYLRRFAERRVFTGPFEGQELFVGAGIDLPSYAMGVLELDNRRCRREFYPPEVLKGSSHTHHGLDDARGHAALLRELMKYRSCLTKYR